MAEMIDFEEAQCEAAPERKFDVRPFKARDIAPAVRIVNKIGLREFAKALSPASVRELVGEAEGEEGVEAVGLGVMLDIAVIVCENFDRAEDDLFALLASLAGMKKDEVYELPLDDAFELVHSVFTARGFADFFTRVRALTSK